MRGHRPIFEFLPHEPRSHVIFRFTRDAVRCGLPLRKLAAAIAQSYMQRVALDERIVQFHTGTTSEQLLKAEVANAQLVQRMIDGIAKLPVDIEEAWVAALPEPQREECARELVRRHGFLAARPPVDDKEGGSVAGIAELAMEFGQTMEAIAPILADGRIDEADRPYLKRALKESHDLMAAIVGLQRQLTEALPDEAMKS